LDFQSPHGRILLWSPNTNGTAYIYTCPALEETKLLQGDGIGNNQFGSSFATFGDTVLVGAFEVRLQFSVIFVVSGAINSDLLHVPRMRGQCMFLKLSTRNILPPSPPPHRPPRLFPRLMCSDNYSRRGLVFGRLCCGAALMILLMQRIVSAASIALNTTRSLLRNASRMSNSFLSPPTIYRLVHFQFIR
jgi:hypothetical protein